MSHFRTAAFALLLLGLSCQAQAARSYDNCTGYITTLPASITTQGTWCLRADVATGISGAAITVATNNVTLDCNDFKLGGLAAGATTTATGILAQDRVNITVRNCNVRGFHRGVYLAGGAGHRVEDSRFDGNTGIGVLIDGDGSTAQGNRILQTGGSTHDAVAVGIVARGSADVIDNTVARVSAGGTGERESYGILLEGNSSGTVTQNRVRGVKGADGVNAAIVSIDGGHVVIANNDLSGGTAPMVGVYCDNADALLTGNIVANFVTAVTACTLGTGNVISP